MPDKKILDEFCDDYLLLAKYEKKETNIFDVMGYSHYENVCSNILAYLMDYTKGHELGDLVFKSFLSVANIEYKGKKKIKFYREKATNNGRIDLLIIYADTAIVIENKIYAKLTNDLQDYWNFIYEKFSKKIEGVVLSVFNTKIDSPKYKNVKYSDVFFEIRKNALCEKIGSGKYWTFLWDFMENIETIENRSRAMDIEFVDFARRRIETLSDIYKRLKNLSDYTRSKTQELLRMLEPEKDYLIRENRGNIWVYEDENSIENKCLSVIAIDYIDLSKKYTIDVAFDLFGWSFSIKKSKEDLEFEKYIKDNIPPKDGCFSDGRFRFQNHFKCEDPVGQVLEYLNKIISMTYKRKCA